MFSGINGFFSAKRMLSSDHDAFDILLLNRAVKTKHSDVAAAKTCIAAAAAADDRLQTF